MLIRLFVLFCFVLLTACSPRPEAPPPVSYKRIKQVRPVSAFNRADVAGIIDVSLHTGYSKSAIILHGDPRDLAGVSIVDNKGTLQIIVGEGYPDHGRIKAEIRTRNLKYFKYKGQGTITGNKLHTNGLTLIINNKGRTKLGGYLGIAQVDVNGGGYVELNDIHSSHLRLKLGGDTRLELKGVANAANIDVSGGAWMKLHWVKSPVLHINARDRANIQLAGTAVQLHVKLSDKARFNGRYLRADRAFIKTYGQSLAEVSAVKRQHTLASDASDIHFYTIPEIKTDFMAFNGSVLDMRDWNLPFIQGYDLYNK